MGGGFDADVERTGSPLNSLKVAMDKSSSTSSAPMPKSLTGRIDFARDYLTQRRSEYQERLKLPDDNPWREGAREMIDLLTPAITRLQQALKLARTPQPTDANSSGWMFPDPAEELIRQGRSHYLQMYWEACQTIDSNRQPIAYDADRERVKRVARQLANTFSRIFYWEEI